MRQELTILSEGLIKEIHRKGYVVIDVETTGLSPTKDKIIEFAARCVREGKVVSEKQFLINPEKNLSSVITRITGLTDRDLQNQPTEAYYVKEIIEEITKAPLIVGHNVKFDIGMLEALLDRQGYTMRTVYIDTLRQCRQSYKNLKSHKLGTVTEHLGLSTEGLHRAMADVHVTDMIFRDILKKGI